jgi:hypothetical protein
LGLLTHPKFGTGNNYRTIDLPLTKTLGQIISLISDIPFSPASILPQPNHTSENFDILNKFNTTANNNSSNNIKQDENSNKVSGLNLTIPKIKLFLKNEEDTTDSKEIKLSNSLESIEPYASNMYVRKVLSGEYLIVNKHLVKDLKAINKWNEEILTELQYDNGSVQKLDIPDYIKNKYKTAFELKQSVIVKQSIDRGLFIDQSQSMNLFMELPDYNKLASAHIYAWKNGLKTGSYYIRSKPVTEATKFSIDIDKILQIKKKRGEYNNPNYTDFQISNNVTNINKKNNSKLNNEEEICTMCSA